MIVSEKGFSFIELLFALLILILLASLLLPQMILIEQKVEERKELMSEAEAMYNIAKLIRKTKQWSGNLLLDQVEYQYDFDGASLCMQYERNGTLKTRCISVD